MLKVTIEIYPFGCEESKKTLGEMTVINIGGNCEKGNYAVNYKSDDENKVAIIKGYNRSLGARKLVERALRRIK